MAKTDLTAKTKAELLKLAQRLGLRGITTITKAVLLRKIEEAQEQKAAARKRASSKVVAAVKKTVTAIKRRAVRKRTASAKPALVKPKSKTTAKPTRTKAVKAPATVPGVELAAHKFDISPSPKPVQKVVMAEPLGELPEAYGTGRLFLTARDPNWLYAYWDLTRQQLDEWREQAVDKRVVLRLFEQNIANPVQEITIQPDARNWYIQVSKPATTFRAQLGIWMVDGQFRLVSESRSVTTPSAVVSSDTTARFVTIPLEMPIAELIELVRRHGRQGEPLAAALHQLQVAGVQLPFQVHVEMGPWTTEQAAAVEQALGGVDGLRRVPVGSAEFAEWLRRRLQEQMSSGGLFSPGGASWSAAPGKGFWLAVNTEIIIYGATEPGATVTLDGNPLPLEPDGTFHFHFALEDGKYRMPIVAVSRARDDQRSVELKFERQTATQGEVGTVPSGKTPLR